MSSLGRFFLGKIKILVIYPSRHCLPSDIELKRLQYLRFVDKGHFQGRGLAGVAFLQGTTKHFKDDSMGPISCKKMNRIKVYQRNGKMNFSSWRQSFLRGLHPRQVSIEHAYAMLEHKLQLLNVQSQAEAFLRIFINLLLLLEEICTLIIIMDLTTNFHLFYIS